jgi:O-antigen ligase
MPGVVQSVRGSLFLLAAWAAYPLIQLVPLPMAIADFAGGDLHGLYGQLPVENPYDYAYLSIDRGATYSGFLRQCGLVALFASVLVLATSTARLRALMVLILLVGFVEALYGLVLYLAGDELALWFPGQAMGTVSGTYVNQNHFAGLMELAIPVGFGLLLSGHPVGGAVSGTRDYARSLSGFLLGRRGIILFCILIMSAALILTTSRGGTGSLAIGIAVAIAIAGSKRGVRARELRVGMMAVVLALIAVFWLGPGQFSEKLKSAGFSSNRAEQRELSFEIIADSPLVGTGVGTYRWIFPTYKDERFGAYFYEHAHNDFLEVLTEQGIIGFSLLAAGMILLFVRVVRAFVRRHDPLMRGALFATIAGCVSLMVHGLVDFNLQIPANASYFFVLLGIGVVASKLRSQPEIRQTGLSHARLD